MTDYEATFVYLERRAKRLRGLAWAADMAFFTATAVVVAVLVLRFSFSSSVAWPIWLFAPGLLGAVGFVSGSTRQVDLARILLKTDLALHLDGRLSTLFEIRTSPLRAVLAQRIARGLPEPAAAWGKAHPVRAKHVSMALGGVVLAIVAGAFFQPGVSEPAALSGPMGADNVPEISSPAVSSEITSPAGSETSEGGDNGPTSSNLSEEAPSSPGLFALTDILDEIRSQDGAEAALLSESEATGLAVRPTSAGTLSDVLQEIEDRLTEDDEPLTAEEMDALRAYMKFAPSELTAALESILQSESPDQALDRIRDVLGSQALSELSRSLQLQTDGDTADRQTESPDDAGNGDRPSGPATGGASDGASEGAGEEVPAPEDETPSVTGDDGRLFPIFPTTDGEEAEVRLVEDALPMSIGEVGGYTYYLTKGVPIEQASETPNPSDPSWSLSYDQVESVVVGRDLSSEVLAAIKEYFRRISEGGS